MRRRLNGVTLSLMKSVLVSPDYEDHGVWSLRGCAERLLVAAGHGSSKGCAMGGEE